MWFSCGKYLCFLFSSCRYYVMELGLGSLNQMFKNKCNGMYNGPNPTQEELLLQLARGLEYIHQEKLIHRDIKPENVLIFSPVSGDPPLILKWSDFGLCKPLNEHGSCSLSGVNGTLIWMAPELLLLQDESDDLKGKRGTVSSDIFSAVCLFFYSVTNGLHHPFGKIREIPTITNIINLDATNETGIK